MSVCEGCKKEPGSMYLEGTLWHPTCIVCTRQDERAVPHETGWTIHITMGVINKYSVPLSKCEKCKKQLDLEAFSTLQGVPYCKTHLRLAIISLKRSGAAVEPVSHSFPKDEGDIPAPGHKALEPSQPEPPAQEADSGVKKGPGKLGGGAFANKLAGLIGGGPPPGVAGGRSLGSAAPRGGGGLTMGGGVTKIAEVDTSGQHLVHPTKSRAKPAKGRRPPTKKAATLTTEDGYVSLATTTAASSGGKGTSVNDLLDEFDDDILATINSYKATPTPPTPPPTAFLTRSYTTPAPTPTPTASLTRSNTRPSPARTPPPPTSKPAPPPPTSKPAPPPPTSKPAPPPVPKTFAVDDDMDDFEKMLEEAEMEGGSLTDGDERRQKEEERRREEEEETKRRKRREEEEQRRRRRMEDEERRRRELEEEERKRREEEEEIGDGDEDEELFMQLLREEQEKLAIGGNMGDNSEIELQLLEEEERRKETEKKAREERERREKEDKERRDREDKERREREEKERERGEREKRIREETERRVREEREKREKEDKERRDREDKERRDREDKERREREEKERERGEREKRIREDKERREREEREQREREVREEKERRDQEEKARKERETSEDIERLERELEEADREHERILRQQEEELIASLLLDMENEVTTEGDSALGTESSVEDDVSDAMAAQESFAMKVHGRFPRNLTLQQLNSLAMRQDAQLEEAFSSLDVPGLARYMTSRGITLQSLLSMKDEKVLDDQMSSIGISQRGVRERIVKHIIAIQRRGGIESDLQFWETTMYQNHQEHQLSALGDFILTKGQELLTGEDVEGATTAVVTLKDDGHQGIGRNRFKFSFTFQLKQQNVST